MPEETCVLVLVFKVNLKQDMQNITFLYLMKHSYNSRLLTISTVSLSNAHLFSQNYSLGKATGIIRNTQDRSLVHATLLRLPGA